MSDLAIIPILVAVIAISIFIGFRTTAETYMLLDPSDIKNVLFVEYKGQYYKIEKSTKEEYLKNELNKILKENKNDK